MWLFIPYVIAQIVLWFATSGDFSALAKSSDCFVILATIRSIVNVDSLESLTGRLNDYLLGNLYHQYRSKFRRRLDSVYYRHFETIILVIVSLAFQFL